jgi:hypothetical protein
VSTLFKVEAAEVSGTRIRLSLESVHPDAGPFGTDDVFALRLLHDTAFEFDAQLNYKGTSPLGEAVTYDELEDEEWAHENASKYVSAVDVEPDDLPEEVPTGTVAEYDIEVTDPRWLEHLETGQTWNSAAFS